MFKPRKIKKGQLRIHWVDVLARSAPTGPAGIHHQTDQLGTNLLEYRDKEGGLRGVLIVYGAMDTQHSIPRFQAGELMLMTDPARQRRGIGGALLAEAERLGLSINFEKQCYTPAGWRAVRKHLEYLERLKKVLKID